LEVSAAVFCPVSADVEEDVEAEEVGVVEDVVEDSVVAAVPVEDEELDVCAGDAVACLAFVLSE
jgi:hypothetical protein